MLKIKSVFFGFCLLFLVSIVSCFVSPSWGVLLFVVVIVSRMSTTQFARFFVFSFAVYHIFIIFAYSKRMRAAFAGSARCVQLGRDTLME